MSGIVRKIDELGRIVIPKELRKALTIKNDDDIEITIVDDKKIILEKFYRLKSLEEIILKYSSIMDKYLISKFLITDKEKIIVTSKKLKEVINSKIGLPIIDMIENRKQVLESKSKNIKISSSLEFNKYFYFYPIIINTDILGSIILLNDTTIGDKDITIVEIIISLLKLKLEC